MEIESHPSPFTQKTSSPLLQISNESMESMENQINIIRKMSSLSFVDPPSQGQSTFMTSLVICNNIIGSTVMILPLVFGKCGIFTSLIVMIIIGAINFITCNLYVIHLKRNESDIPQIIERILGIKWKVIYVVTAILMEFLGGIVFLILMNNMLYPVVTFLFEKCGSDNYAKKSETRYDIYSFQINAWILSIPCYLSCYVKKINIFATLSKIGTYVLCLYVIFLIYIVCDSYNYGILPENLENVSYFTSNITEVSGAFCMAFFVHPSICPLIKPIKIEKESTKALGIGYVLSAIFYFLVGVIGFLGIRGRTPVDDHPQTIMDYFERDSFSPVIIEFLYFLKLGSIYPIFCFISKSQFLSIFLQKYQQKGNCLFSFIYNTIYISVGMVCVLYNINLTFVIGFSAAVFGFLFVYWLPIYIHLKCYESEEDEKREEKRCNEHKEKFLYSHFLRGCFYMLLIVPIGIYLIIIQFVALFDLKWM